MAYTNSNSFFNQAIKNRNDEYYTTKETVEFMLSLIDISKLKDKVVWSPFQRADGIESEFEIYFRKLEKDGLIKEFISTGYDFFDKVEELKKADIIIDNIPFSIQKEIFELLERYDKKYYLIAGNNPNLVNLATHDESLSIWCGNQYHIHDGIKVNMRNCYFVSNIFNLTHAKKKLDPNKRASRPIPLWVDINNVDTESPIAIVSTTTSFAYDFDKYFYIYCIFAHGDKFRRILWINKREREREQQWIDYIREYYNNDVRIERKYNCKAPLNVKSLFDF